MNNEFKFGLNQNVSLTLSDEPGFVIGRAQYISDQNQYQVRYLAADGRQVEQWFAENALKSTYEEKQAA